MRLLFCGDLAPTGFGSVTTDLGRALLDKGVDVRFLSQNDFPTLPEPFLSRTLDVATFPIIPPSEAMPQGGIDYDAMQNLLGKIVDGAAGRLHLANGESWGEWRPEAILLLGDYYGIRLTVDKAGLEPFQKVPTFHYCPIEGHDLPPNWRGLWDIIKPIAMSKFGQDEMEKVLGYRPPMFYHGIDTDTFRPVTPTEPLSIVTSDRTVVLSSKEMCKRFFGIDPRMKLLLRCDANMPRKAYPSLLRALEPILTERPDVAFVMKTSNYDQGGYLLDSISKLPQHVYDRIHLLESKLPREGLVALYNAADVYVSNSSEGFGLTIGEALACGVPAVGIDYSSVPEVIGPAGTVVPPAFYWDNGYAHYWALPDETAFGKAVAYMLDHPSRAREMGHMGPAHVKRTFRWDEAADVLIGVINGRLDVHTAPTMVAA